MASARSLVDLDQRRRTQLSVGIGSFATVLSQQPAQPRPLCLAIRRSIERVVFEARTEIANACLEIADKCGEPPLTEQG